MIKTFSDLIEYTYKIEETVSLSKQTYSSLIVTPGCPEADCDRLEKALHMIPNSYLRCLKEFQLKGLVFMNFVFWPQEQVKAKDIVDALILANDNDFYGQFNGYYVASFDIFPICVKYKNEENKSGKVFWIDTNLQPIEKDLCDDFEILLLLAGNFIEVLDKNNYGFSSKSEFVPIMKAFNLSATQENSWLEFMDMSIYR